MKRLRTPISSGKLSVVLVCVRLSESKKPRDRTRARAIQRSISISALTDHYCCGISFPRTLLEDKLSSGWGEFIGGDVGGARVSNWNTQLSRILESKYDVTIYDVGPSLGALNRSILVGADYFVAPMGCDIFSLMGIDNIATWISRWHRQYQTAYAMCQENNQDLLKKYDIKPSLNESNRFLGYTVQQYITKVIKGERRATEAYEQILNEIPARIEKSLANLMAPGINPKLGDVPHMYSLVPLAQSAHVPIHGLTSKDGISGGQYTQQNEYNTFIYKLVDALFANLQAGQANKAKALAAHPKEQAKSV